jgi:hypothetical protein
MTTGFDMRERLLRQQQENEREMAERRHRQPPPPQHPQGLRDMRHLHAEAQHDQVGAMRMLVIAMGIALLTLLGLLFGLAGADWWTDTNSVHTVAQCVARAL